ncbi:TPA: hybrid sensor histidine kinase/response regulator [Candidatus Galligastranaerophilus faecipullorum]|nr:hybrid sensor histidine kinase/response regulator [Candidatus Galligastranaerophilus faecipullorum]
MDFLDDELDEILNIFQQEGGEILQSMDKNLFALEKDPKNHDILIRLARDAHSLKGSARMLGFESIQTIAHKIEDILGFIKDGKIESAGEITDTISEALSHIQVLINKTVEQKSEYKTPDTQNFVEKLEKIASAAPDGNIQSGISFNYPEDVKKLLSKLNKIEELIVQMIYIFSGARQSGDFSEIQMIKSPLAELNVIIRELNLKPLCTLITDAGRFVTSFENKPLDENAILELNGKIDKIEEFFSNYCKEKGVQTQNYFEIASELLANKDEDRLKSGKKEDKKIIADLIDRIYEKLSLLEINLEFLPDIKELLSQVLTKIKNNEIKKIFETILNILNLYQSNSKNLENDTLEAIKEICENTRKIFEPEGLKPEERKLEIELLVQKITIVEQMSKLNIAKPKSGKKLPKTEKTNQDWLSAIDTSDIKTLRIDSFKLDKLVNQIGDLIITRIKTNEHLSVAKNIQNELLEWQKSFNKMGYYIKYFDRKYLSGPTFGATVDPRAIAAFNKQLMVLQNYHSEKMVYLIKETTDLFKQMQENDSKLNSTASEIEGMVKNMRILPLSTIFHLFPRMVHNIAKEKGKQIEFITEGADVAADKKIIEEIKIPLIHILRNSIDHGIELPQERKEAGKNPVGKITVSAKHRENKIIINITDDGRGLDVEKIKQKALEKGLLTPDEIENIDEEHLVNLIFYPGFTTGDSVTELSGRGLGLDIVHTKISQLNGRVDIFSEFQKGTMVTIELPATMATIKTFIVTEQNQLYAIPTSSIKTVIRIDTTDVFERDGRNFYIHNDDVIPIYTLSQILELENKPRQANKYTLMIVKSESSAIGIIVEKLICDQEVLHKKLEAPLFKVKNISGITTLANGEICLILNVGDIFSSTLPKKINTKIIASNKAIKMRENYTHKILVVDDSLTTRTLQKNILTSYGYRVQIATNAPDALIKMQKENFDLVITDNEMPIMSGLEFVKEIRKESKWADIPIIVLTSMPESKWGKQFKEAGSQAYIQKDRFEQESFIRCVDHFLKKAD